MLEDFFRHHHYDVIVARDYYFIAYLKTYIPIVYVGDTTLDLMKDYLHLPKHLVHQTFGVMRQSCSAYSLS